MSAVLYREEFFSNFANSLADIVDYSNTATSANTKYCLGQDIQIYFGYKPFMNNKASRDEIFNHLRLMMQEIHEANIAEFNLEYENSTKIGRRTAGILDVKDLSGDIVFYPKMLEFWKGLSILEFNLREDSEGRKFIKFLVDRLSRNLVSCEML